VAVSLVVLVSDDSLQAVRVKSSNIAADSNGRFRNISLGEGILLSSYQVNCFAMYPAKKGLK
jgi:L-ribulose-5-phosphate 3-epimerase UlaE